MNGTEPQVEIFKPFGEAFELMKKILFQPFDLKKWLVIGFAAFLASLSGGFHSSFNPSSRWSSRDEKAIADSFHQFASAGQMEWWLIVLIVVGALILLAVILTLMWLGARGRFIFTDCIVHNRAAIVAPWKEFRVEGNSFFLFWLVIACVVVALVMIAAVALIVPFVQTGGDAQMGVGFWIGLCVFVFFILCLVFAWVLVSQFMVVIMYRQRCRARRAFAKIMELIGSHPGPILLYVLFLIVISLAAAIISCAAACVTCCIAAIPYVGTVILLPIPVTLCAFSLLFLRQFGPDYDVWASFVPPEFSPILSSAPPGSLPTSTASYPPPEPPSFPAA
jgi:hypothetical protein